MKLYENHNKVDLDISFLSRNPQDSFKISQQFKLEVENNKHISNSAKSEINDNEEVIENSCTSDFANLAMQSAHVTRNFRFWETNAVSMHDRELKLEFDTHLYLDKAKNMQIIEYANSFNIVPNTNDQPVNTKQIIKNLLSLCVTGNSDFFVLNENGKILIKDWTSKTDSISQGLFRNFISDMTPNIIRFRCFFTIKQSITSFSNIDNLYEKNFLVNLVNLFEEFINYQMLCFASCTSLLEFLKNLRLILMQTGHIVDFLQSFEKKKSTVSILDFIDLFHNHLPQSETLTLAITEAFNFSILPLMKVIYQVAFRNSPLDLLNKNMKMAYEHDENYKYRASNVPDLLKTIVDDILVIKHNYMLLGSADKELLTLSLNNDMVWFENLNISEVKIIYERIKTSLINQKRALNEVIIRRMVN